MKYTNEYTCSDCSLQWVDSGQASNVGWCPNCKNRCFLPTTSTPRHETETTPDPLTTAAPELLEALQNILNGIETGAIRIDTVQDETWGNALHKAKAAIAKAHGE